MSDPRFFRKYLDILDEQPLPAGVNQTTVNVGDNTSVTADKSAGTVTAKTNVGGTDISATRNLNTGNLNSVNAATNVGGTNIKATQDFTTAKTGAGQVSVNAPVAPNTAASATHTQAGYKGQMVRTSQVGASYKDPTGQTHDVLVHQGAMAQGSGKNAQPGQNIATTYTTTTPQGKTTTYGTNRNL